MTSPDQVQSTQAVSNARNAYAATCFKRVADGYVYRAPNPWVFGLSRHYLVTQPQRDEIIISLFPESKAPTARLASALGIGVVALAFSSLVTAMLALYGNRFALAEAALPIMTGLVVALLVFTLVALHRMAKQQLAILQPILAGASPTDIRISNDEVLWSAQTSGDPQRQRRQWIIGGVTQAVVSVSFLSYALVSWPQHGGDFLRLQSVFMASIAIISALQAAISFHRARNATVAAISRTNELRCKRAFICVVALYLVTVLGHTGLQQAGVIRHDYASTVERAEIAASHGDVEAMSRLGWLYRDGKGVAQDYIKSHQWYEKAAAAGNASSMYWLGWSYQKGLGVAQDYVKAREWYEKSVAAGDTTGLFWLGWFAQHGYGVAKNYDQARAWFDKAAAAGDTAAMNWIGWNYQNGLGVARDYVKAREWFEKAAIAGNAPAMHNLAMIYHNGWGMGRDDLKAHEWLEKAAATGRSASMDQLGVFYTNGWGIAQDSAKARGWYEKAAAAGNLDGMQHAASLLDNGAGGPRDPIRAAHLVLQSAKLGHPWSRTVLAGPLTFLTPATRTELKRELIRLGHYTGTVDAQWDAGARAAAESYLKSAG